MQKPNESKNKPERLMLFDALRCFDLILSVKRYFYLKKRIFLVGMVVLFPVLTFAENNEKQLFEAESAKLAGTTKIQADNAASGKQIVRLSKPADKINFLKLPKAEKLAIRYASVNVGTISVVVNHQPAVKVNVHSSAQLQVRSCIRNKRSHF
jgi:hypothetical protein